MNYKQLTPDDKHTDTTKVTKGLFTGGAGALTNEGMSTSSISSSNDAYSYTIVEGSGSSATSRFDVSYGHRYGSGSLSTSYLYPTKAVYKQFANLILPQPVGSDGHFSFKDVSASATSHTPDDIYIMTIKHDTTKDRLDDKWTIELSGSLSGGVPKTLHLTNYTGSVDGDDSEVGAYYKVISGSAGVPSSLSAEATVYGYFYPQISTVIFSGTSLSASMPGSSGSITSVNEPYEHYISSSVPLTTHMGEGGIGAGHQTTKGPGFAPNLAVDGTANNAGKFVNVLLNPHNQGGFDGSTVTFRSVEDVNQTTYYCRAFHNQFNFSNNPSFYLSGSTNGEIITEQQGEPNVYITGVGMYNTSDELIAVAKLSAPQKKNFNTEVTVAAKIDG